jgi:hypothetical protein
MRKFLTCITTISLCYALHGQYIVTTNAKCIAALEEKSQKGDPSLKTAIRFLETAQNGTYKQWLSLLSKEYNDSAPAELKMREWWNYLSSGNTQYDLIAEQPAKIAGNKIVYFKSQSDSNIEKILKIMVVKENNEWKVQSVEL